MSLDEPPGEISPTLPTSARPALLARLFPRPTPRVQPSRQPLIWGATGLALIFALTVLNLFAPDSCLRAVFILLFVFWCLVTVFLVLRWLWRRLTYRIGMRLFLSYLLIGALPFPILLLLIFIAGYLLFGQYTSAEFGDLTEQVQEELAVLTQSALEQASPETTEAILARGPRWPGELAEAPLPTEWLFSTSGETRTSPGASGTPLPAWAGEGTISGPFLLGERPVLAAIIRRGDRLAAVFLPYDRQTARLLSERLWYTVRFQVSDIEVTEGGTTFNTPDEGLEETVVEAEEETREETREETKEETDETPLGWWQRRKIFFVNVSPEVRRWENGQVVEKRSVVSVLATSGNEVTADFLRSPYRVGREISRGFLAFVVFLGLIYLGAVLLAALQIFAITRAASRLTRGALAVQEGELGYRIPVRRRDQLGDLAVSFNQMTAAVEQMLTEVAEKERLKSELGLAREIQQSLLPASRLRHGGLAVTAYFRPTAEVGGDYYDLFPIGPRRLLVASGDVAGHGLSTGLFMAMVKSAVATLVHEGHRGVGLLERLNPFMLAQARAHRMVTLALVEIDAEKGVAEITSAGHPPILSLAGGEVRELLLPALPLGFAWRRKPPSLTLELSPGWRLVIFSDGLVEALDPAGEPVGYERLREWLSHHAALTAEELLAALLAELDRHAAGRALDDDLTVVIVEEGGGEILDDQALAKLGSRQ